MGMVHGWCFVSFSQSLPEIKELRLNIPDYDQARLKRAEKLIRDAEQLVNTARDKYSPNNEDAKKDAFKDMGKAADKYKTAVAFATETYEDHIDYFMNDLDARYKDNIDRGMHYYHRSSVYLKKAKDNRRKLKKLTAYENYYYSLLETFEFERMGIINLARALRIFQDWPVEYNYEWDDYVRPLDPLLVEDRRRDSIQAEKDIKDAKQKGSKDSTIIFKAQIAAHTIKMDEKYLREKIYKGNREIYLSVAEDWYRYDIGTFYSYEEARKIVQESDVEKAFVAAYQNGKRIAISEAVKRTKMN